MHDPIEIATEIVARRAGPMFFMRRMNDPSYRQDEIDELVAALRSYGAACAAAERERCAAVAALLFIRDPYALHPDISFDQLNSVAQLAAHSTAQIIAVAIRALD